MTLRAFIWTLGLSVLVALAAAAGPARAQGPPVELRQGDYINQDADTRSTTRLTFSYMPGAPICEESDNGSIECQEVGPQGFEVRLWGACTPEDCDWGTVSAERHLSDGNSYYTARYDQGFAEREIEIYPTGTSSLRLVVHTTYSDDRADRTSRSMMALGRVSWEPGTNRVGSDYRNFSLSGDRPGLCARQCEAEKECRAFTYVKPGVQGSDARCWLKDAVPRPRDRDCCVSGVKQ